MNVLILLYLLLIAPKLFLDRVFRGKRHPGFLQRFGMKIPKTDRPVIWIHAVSVGEVKAAQPLYRELKKREPHSYFLITTTSSTGQAEAKRSLPEADAFAYLPVDLSWIVNLWVRKLNPKRFILVESDFWLNLLSALKKNGTQITLVSGKMSKRSAKRFRFFSFFAKKLFGHFDHLCLQNEEHLQRFLPLVPDPTRIHVTGNLKLDIQTQPIERKLEFPPSAVTISCTHAKEEEWILDALIGGGWFLILAPRHPERFQEVAALLTRKNIPFTRWSHPEPLKKVLLVDAMGQMPLCYAHSRLAILGGSFVDHIGGHNVLEPCLYGTPVIFGPHMFSQVEFAKRVLESEAGFQVPLSLLPSTVTGFFSDPKKEEAMRGAARRSVQAGSGSTARTINVLFDAR